MQALKTRFDYLFNSTKGLILVAIAMLGIVTAVWGTLSGPMAEMGVREVTARILGMDLVQVEREGRIIILYHSIAMAIIAIEVYMITSLLKMKPYFKTMINATVTFGYILTMFFGLLFAYFGHNWIFHGVYIFGLSLIFFAGLLLIIALWPFSREYHVTDKNYANFKGLDIERTAFFATALTTVISAVFGAIPGSFFGNGFEAFLAENVIRYPVKSTLQYSIIGHLHIMLALISIMITLIIGRWLNFKGILHKFAMPLMILGTIVLNLGVWGIVTPLQPIAHTIIYVGATPAMFAALLLVIYGFDMLIREGTAHIKKPNFGNKISALVRDPLRFGPLWQMIFMNFTTSGIGIFMAIRLHQIFRVWPAREERIELTGHWHVLSAIVATIILLYYGDMVGLKGKLRQWYGWLIIIPSNIAFAAVTIFEMKRLFISEATQQPLVNNLMLAIDFGLGLLLVVLAVLMVYRLIDLFKSKGRWTKEMTQELAQEVNK
ncbi:MAG: hypothetical protein B6D39_12055 [Anaerolineae bacterium UTCFX2]|jgi:hypothetical protein|nr:hypothetical protein [Anaerolineae bacterium]MCZ7554270.1 hypothetical protein [Anaerolineales bacterium]OQY87939.1 MAG: hypothetical protein B6D39_12055 [Anaerolineae bacterium UTCFX2]